MNDLIRFEEVDAFYGRAHVLHSVSFTILEGDSIAILGRNGVGKTTVVNTILGIANWSGKRLELAGQTHRRIRPYLAAQLGISVVIQGRGILPNLTVHENLELGAASGRAGLWTIGRVFDLFPILRERSNTSGTALSGGQQQMLALGRALMGNPRLLVLDEPSEGLAPVIVDEVARVLNRVYNEGTAILLIEQNLTLVKRVAREFYVLSKGRIIDRGDARNTDTADLHKHIVI